MDVAGDGHLRPTGRNIYHVSGKQGGVLGHVAQYQQVVEIEVGDGLPIAPELNVAEGALNGRAAGGKQRGDQRAERTEGISSRTTGLADDEHLNRPKLPHFHIKIEALVNMAEGVMNMLLDSAHTASRQHGFRLPGEGTPSRNGRR